jgi:hypothetical protein
VTRSAGLVILLSGDLGAGKTQLVRGLARGLGCTSRVHSPDLHAGQRIWGGRLKLFHLDLYRLETPEQLHSAGIRGISAARRRRRHRMGRTFECRRIGSLEDQNVGNVKIEVRSETERRIVYEDSGA